MHVTFDPGAEPARPVDRSLEVRDLEPEQDTVAERNLCSRQRTVVMTDVDPMELQDELAADDDLLVLLAAVPALGAEEPVKKRLDACTSWTTTSGCGHMRAIERLYVFGLGRKRHEAVLDDHETVLLE